MSLRDEQRARCTSPLSEPDKENSRASGCHGTEGRSHAGLQGQVAAATFMGSVCAPRDERLGQGDSMLSSLKDESGRRRKRSLPLAIRPPTLFLRLCWCSEELSMPLM
ncbi:hypothetical protein CesoFtcFv8_001602 [Champsocephalus esox]|uniref:Uncharacterized protein n=1 Tax=Champsocephalus esox TaxID=159716 RepID=A0AAN8D694_9TELE|nr:hypothetical protein CesoFtcFv8_001602 [Champsocephalus esox]